MGWGNNHTHLHKFKGKYYLFYHSTLLEQSMKNEGAMNSEASGYRSIGVDLATVNENTQTINKMTLTRNGVEAIGNIDPYELQEAETMATCGGISYEDFTNISKNTRISTLGNDASRNMQVKMQTGAWILLRKVEFGTNGASKIMVRAKGEGTVEVRLGRKGASPVATLDISSSEMSDFTVDVDANKLHGQKNVYIAVTSGSDVYLDAWQATEALPDAIDAISGSKIVKSESYDLSGRRLPDAHQHRGIVIEQYTDEKGVKHSRKRR
jgi:arabinoxylan arabinofuranohydrolase